MCLCECARGGDDDGDDQRDCCCCEEFPPPQQDLLLVSDELPSTVTVLGPGGPGLGSFLGNFSAVNIVNVYI